MKRETTIIVRALCALSFGSFSGLTWAANCSPGEIEDCYGNCTPVNWINDGFCDDGSFAWDGNAIYLNCSEYQFDGGDCETGLPISGMPVASMAPLDMAVVDLMQDEDISAGAVGVMKNGVIVYQRFFGWKDEARTVPLMPDTMMRVASITKPHTAASIRTLVADGVISLNDNVFDLAQPGGGLLKIGPFGGRLGDQRLAAVTVRDCLLHQGGWNRNSTFGVGDLTYREIEIKTAYGQDAPATPEQTVSWILSQPLQHAPGTVNAYSNIGYLVLGLVVEEYAGKDPVEFLHERVLAPVGVLPEEVELGRSLPADRNPREPWYDDQGATWSNVFATLDDLQNDPAGQLVARPDGGWHQEGRVGQGGLIMTPRALLKFLDTYTAAGTNIGAPRNKAAESPTFFAVHTGAMSRGTNALAQHWGDGYNLVVMFNRRELDSDESSYVSIIRDAFRDMLDNGEIVVPDCPPNYVADCNGICGPAVWLGDGGCDSNTPFGSAAIDYNCEALEFDLGDCTPCPADLDDDGAVGIDDLLAIIDAFGICGDPSNCPTDLDGDGFVTIDDLLAGITAFGVCP